MLLMRPTTYSPCQCTSTWRTPLALRARSTSKGLWNHCAMVDYGQVRRRGRWSPDEFLEYSTMEPIMKTRARRQFQADNDIVDQFGDTVGADEARLELPRGRAWKGDGRALTEVQERPVADLVRHRAMLPVVVALLDEEDRR